MWVWRLTGFPQWVGLWVGAVGRVGTVGGWVGGFYSGLVQWVLLVVDGWGPKWSPRLWSLLSSALLGAASTRSVISDHAHISLILSGSCCQNYTYICLAFNTTKEQNGFQFVARKENMVSSQSHLPSHVSSVGTMFLPTLKNLARPCLAGPGQG